jgi:hypothetical protein
MATFKFKKPQDPFQPWHTKNGILNIPARPGVYIWGYWVKYEETNGKNVRKFCPVNVGETGNLRRRLITDHYFGNLIIDSNNRRIYGGEKEIFDFVSIGTRNQLNQLYDAIIRYDERLIKQCPGIPNVNCFFCDPQNFRSLLFFRHLDSLVNVRGLLPHLLQQMQDADGNILLFDAIEHFYNTQRIYHDELISHQEFHRQNFYCIYLETEELAKPRRLELETQLKTLLREELGVGTTAKGFDKPIVDGFDLTVVREDLVTLAQGRIEEKYVNRFGNYHRSRNLILHKPSN